MNPRYIKPEMLYPNDKVAAVTLSWGAVPLFPERYDEGKRRIRDIFGLRVVDMTNTRASHEFLLEHPEEKAKDLMDAFKDPSIKGIFTSIGGDHAIKILPYIDYEVIRNNPKVVMGFSDSTVLNFICLKAGLASFYGPSIMCNFAENIAMPSYEVASIKKNLFSSEVVGEIEQGPGYWTEEFLNWGESPNQHKKRAVQKPSDYAGWNFLRGTGVIEGHLLGGCLELLDVLKDSEIWPSLDQWRGSILFIETSELGWSPDKVEEVLRELGKKGL